MINENVIPITNGINSLELKARARDWDVLEAAISEITENDSFPLDLPLIIAYIQGAIGYKQTPIDETTEEYKNLQYASDVLDVMMSVLNLDYRYSNSFARKMILDKAKIALSTIKVMR